MKAWMLAMISRSRTSQSVMLAASGTWTAPQTTNTATIVGVGAPGQPGQAAYTTPSTTAYRIDRYRVHHMANGTQTAPELMSSTPSTVNEPVPDDYCFDDLAGGQYCDSHTKVTYTEPGVYYPAVAPTTGAATVAFGRTFPGGVGGPATAVTYVDILIVPGSAYQLVIPTGGSVAINFIS